MGLIASAAVVLGASWCLAVALLAVGYRQLWRRLWREPVLTRPVLVLESDDWGAGPCRQAAALGRLRAVLERHHDASGRPAAVSLALVLAVPDGPTIAATGRYARRDLGDAAHSAVLRALRDGRDAGVFALQLHGLEHYWPEVLMASPDPAVQAWLRQPELASTERLPSHLQSRWVDARTLPSTPLPTAAVQAACQEEVRLFGQLLGAPADVVVPPTFLWTDEVERAWAKAGVRHLVTPGVRYVQRGADGGSHEDGLRLATGDRRGPLQCLVRTDYFEPRKGRDASHALQALARDTACGRACILENHRDNFCEGEEQAAHAEQELDKLLRGALLSWPGLRFLSTAAWASLVEQRDPAWFTTALDVRLCAFVERAAQTGRPWRLARLLGLGLLARSLSRARGQAARGVGLA